ncbi:hypothetical protein K0M31_013917 [Melipona bicolor]|uniref:Uncharacterized protein n=1 Tax=Melipona bicolor TaxID=60889 RepID=A0AA40G7I2_9HYME|nr:hypothetical protein K0M31_013917 [Melipona bicolor]
MWSRELNEKLKSCSSGHQPSRMEDKYSRGANTICLECEEGVRPMHRWIRQLTGSTIFVIKTPLAQDDNYEIKENDKNQSEVTDSRLQIRNG